MLLAIIAIPSIVCFVFNLLQKHALDVSLFNSILLALSVLFFKNIVKENSLFNALKKPQFYIILIGLGFMPIYSLVLDTNYYISLTVIFSLFLLTAFTNKYIRVLTVAVLILSTFLSLKNLEVMGISFKPIPKIEFSDNTALISKKKLDACQLTLKQMRTNFLLFNIASFRKTNIFYNDSFCYFPVLVNAATFFSPSSFYNAFLIVNIYPFILGLLSFDKKFKNSFFVKLGFLLFLLTAGIYIYNNNVKIFLFFLPMFMSLILLGVQKVNIKIYNLLLLVSVALLFLTPKL
jgi:hypothetical protein